MAESYPHLDHLLGGYLHQDYLAVSGSLDGAVDEYLNLEAPEAAQGLRADLKRFLALHEEAPLAAFNRIFPNAFHIGDDDSAARAWLERILARASGNSGQRPHVTD